MSLVHEFFANGKVDLSGLAKFLDGLDNAGRIAAVRSFCPVEQKALFAATEAKKLTLDHFVPLGTPPLTEVIHYGCNTMPRGLRKFEKRFCRPQSGDQQLFGYNEFFLKGLLGPGYFVARPDEFGSVVVDYYKTPNAKPATWPEIRPNDGLLPALVYGKMYDYMRGVSREVSIGRAVKNGKTTENYFVLCRNAA